MFCGSKRMSSICQLISLETHSLHRAEILSSILIRNRRCTACDLQAERREHSLTRTCRHRHLIWRPHPLYVHRGLKKSRTKRPLASLKNLADSVSIANLRSRSAASPSIMLILTPVNLIMTGFKSSRWHAFPQCLMQLPLDPTSGGAGAIAYRPVDFCALVISWAFLFLVGH
jgi:hypothetical protein